jgi:hypothetical protein
MEWKEFKERYGKADTWGDLNNVLAQLTKEQKKELYDTVKKAKEMIGVTMRDEFLLGTLKAEYGNGA